MKETERDSTKRAHIEKARYNRRYCRLIESCEDKAKERFKRKAYSIKQ